MNDYLYENSEEQQSYDPYGTIIPNQMNATLKIRDCKLKLKCFLLKFLNFFF